MSRLETKCFVGSAGLHGLLLGVFLVGSAFHNSKSQKLPPVFSIVSIPTDRLVSSGGNPNGNPNPPAPAPQPQQPTPPPPQPPPKPEVAKKVEPEKEQPKEVIKPVLKEPKKEIVKDTPKDKGELPTKKDTNKKPVPSKDVASTTPPKRVSTNVVTRSGVDFAALKQKADRERAERAEREAAAALAAQRQALANAVTGIIGGVGQSLGKSTVVEPLGPGGVAYANWGSLVGELYKREVYRSQPQSDEDATAVIRVVVERSGFVKDASWVRKTGNPSLDKPVDRAMKSIRHVPPFPEGATDAQRSFNINIGFEARRVSA